MSGPRRLLLIVGGWLAFALGWAGVFLPGLPTTIFWILAALAFLRTNRRMYEKIIANKRFGPGVKLFVEEGRISARGKVISMAAMMTFACLGALAIPPIWVKVVVVSAAACGSLWVFVLPTPEGAGRSEARALADKGGGVGTV